MRANDTKPKSEDSPYAQEYIGVEKFLDIISLEPTSTDDRFCLSHVFTYRDFEDGVLGLAWVAEPGNSYEFVSDLVGCSILTRFYFFITSWTSGGWHMRDS